MSDNRSTMTDGQSWQVGTGNLMYNFNSGDVSYILCDVNCSKFTLHNPSPPSSEGVRLPLLVTSCISEPKTFNHLKSFPSVSILGLTVYYTVISPSEIDHGTQEKDPRLQSATSTRWRKSHHGSYLCGPSCCRNSCCSKRRTHAFSGRAHDATAIRRCSEIRPVLLVVPRASSAALADARAVSRRPAAVCEALP